MNQKQDSTKIYLDDTIQTFMFQKQALQIKLQHNISELSTKNIYLTTILKELCIKQFQSINQECEQYKKVINMCMRLEDDLGCLDALQKKTQILKQQALQLEKRYYAQKNASEN